MMRFSETIMIVSRKLKNLCQKWCSCGYNSPEEMIENLKEEDMLMI